MRCRASAASAGFFSFEVKLNLLLLLLLLLSMLLVLFRGKKNGRRGFFKNFFLRKKKSLLVCCCPRNIRSPSKFYRRFFNFFQGYAIIFFSGVLGSAITKKNGFAVSLFESLEIYRNFFNFFEGFLTVVLLPPCKRTNASRGINNTSFM